MAEPIKQETLDELYRAFEGVVLKSMSPGVPIPQRILLNNRAQELRAQWIELAAARFNQETSEYEAAVAEVDAAILDLHTALRDIQDMIEIADRAGRIFAGVDKLMKIAASFAAIP